MGGGLDFLSAPLHVEAGRLHPSTGGKASRWGTPAAEPVLQSTCLPEVEQTRCFLTLHVCSFTFHLVEWESSYFQLDLTLTFFELLLRSSYKIANLKLLQQSHRWQTHQTFFFFFGYTTWHAGILVSQPGVKTVPPAGIPSSNISLLQEKPCGLLTIADYLCHKRIPNTLTIYKVPITLGSIPLLLTPKLFSYTSVQVNFVGWRDVALKVVSCPMELQNHLIM